MQGGMGVLTWEKLVDSYLEQGGASDHDRQWEVEVGLQRRGTTLMLQQLASPFFKIVDEHHTLRKLPRQLLGRRSVVAGEDLFVN